MNWRDPELSSVRDAAGNVVAVNSGNATNLLPAPVDNFLLSGTPNFLSKAIYYQMQEGAFSVIKDSLGNGPDIYIGGDTTNIWANPGWLTFDSAGNPMQVTGNAYLNSLFTMAGFSGSIFIAFDYWYDSMNTGASETLFSIWRPLNALGGLKLDHLKTSSTNQIAVCYTTVGGVETQYTTVNDASLIGQRISFVLELNFSRWADTGNVGWIAYRNGAIMKANDFGAVTTPASESVGGFIIGAYYSDGLLQKLGSGTSSGVRMSRFFAMRQEKHNAKAGLYLSQWWAQPNTTLPNSIRSI